MMSLCQLLYVLVHGSRYRLVSFLFETTMQKMDMVFVVSFVVSLMDRLPER